MVIFNYLGFTRSRNGLVLASPGDGRNTTHGHLQLPGLTRSRKRLGLASPGDGRNTTHGHLQLPGSHSLKERFGTSKPWRWKKYDSWSSSTTWVSLAQGKEQAMHSIHS